MYMTFVHFDLILVEVTGTVLLKCFIKNICFVRFQIMGTTVLQSVCDIFGLNISSILDTNFELWGDFG